MKQTMANMAFGPYVMKWISLVYCQQRAFIMKDGYLPKEFTKVEGVSKEFDQFFST